MKEKFKELQQRLGLSTVQEAQRFALDAVEHFESGLPGITEAFVNKWKSQNGHQQSKPVFHCLLVGDYDLFRCGVDVRYVGEVDAIVKVNGVFYWAKWDGVSFCPVDDDGLPVATSDNDYFLVKGDY